MSVRGTFTISLGDVNGLEGENPVHFSGLQHAHNSELPVTLESYALHFDTASNNYRAIDVHIPETMSSFGVMVNDQVNDQGDTEALLGVIRLYNHRGSTLTDRRIVMPLGVWTMRSDLSVNVRKVEVPGLVGAGNLIAMTLNFSYDMGNTAR